MSQFGEQLATRRDSPEISGASGQLISGKYRLGQVLGIGAMGTVWSAVHTELGHTVAIKLIAHEHSQSKEARRRFAIEATAAAKLRSRFVVQVFDSGETDDGLPYLVMEMLEGETLERRMASGPMPLRDVVHITAQVARGLSLAHELGITHRDLKPANIFLAYSDDEGGEIAKVLDFGIAKLSNLNQSISTTRTGTVLGTPQFMSPEQIRGLKTVDFRTDIYALGMVVYLMLTGKPAFRGDAFGDLLLSICTEPLPSMHESANWLPKELDDWFYRCCARSPDDRFQSADAAAEALLKASGIPGRVGSVNQKFSGDNLSDGDRSSEHEPDGPTQILFVNTPLTAGRPKQSPQAQQNEGGGVEAGADLRQHGTISATNVLDVEPQTPMLARPLWLGLASVGAILCGFALVWFFRDTGSSNAAASPAAPSIATPIISSAPPAPSAGPTENAAPAPSAAPAQNTPTPAPSSDIPLIDISALPTLNEAEKGKPPSSANSGKLPPNRPRGPTKSAVDPDLGF